MLSILISSSLHPIPLVEQGNVVTMLIVTVVFFLILLILGIRRSYKLKAENERLSEKRSIESDEENKVYRDFTEGHLYDNN